MHTKENKISIIIEGIPHIETRKTVTIFIGITILSGNANLLYA